MSDVVFDQVTYVLWAYWRNNKKGKAVSNIQSEENGEGRKQEILLFLFLSAILIPALTFILVAGYGFAIWMTQILTGPPTG